MAAAGPSGAGPGIPVLHPGDVLAGRYRLEDAVADALEGTHGTALWRAVDEVLARPVAVKVLPAAGRAGAAAARPFLDAAGVASGLSHPGLARVYDAAVEERRVGRARADVAYVVSEWVDGRALSELLADGPLEPAEAVRLAVQACEAVAAAHACGTPHARMHLGNARVTPAGRLVVTDTAVAAAVADGALPALDDAAVAADTRDLAAVTYALLTARWPSDATPQPAEGVPAAPGRDRRTYSPRQVRAAVPRELDAVVTRALGASGATTGPATPRGLATALEQALPPEPAEPLPSAVVDTGPPPVWRRWLPWVAAVAFVALFASGTYALGKAIGELPAQAGRELDALVQPTPSSAPGATAKPVRIPLDAAGVSVRDFDPQGSDGGENPAQVVNATDGDVTTAWLTSAYKTAALGGLKKGVGLLVDLGSESPLTRVDLGLTTGGSDVEVRVGSVAPQDAEDLQRVARKADTNGTGVTSLAVPPGTRARYVLVWFTRLPRDGETFREGVDELVLVR